ncbi:putative deoxyuridine triphosphatase [Trypanosoma vivax]|uniref:Putative deoxyuridine triphosphatase n=1 Tax=Trypanosoma vivax (strain Y486) TaxID=1055687 RepID=G0TYZ3_TRYVY|nr:putative deoxyuridine triphosphatase [Trypanosoma vivax]CCC49196.1 putative deoxyuridine triphosphatase [Trypanosoma vivax Y486]
MRRFNTTLLSPTILSSLMELQDGLNTLIDANWRNVRTPDDWGLALTVEAVELIDSYPWKWWKNVNAEPDLQNVKIELTDMLHFSLSGTIQVAASSAAPDINGLSGVDESGKTQTRLMHLCLPKCSNGVRAPVPVEQLTVSDFMFFPLTETANAVASIRNIVQLSNFHSFQLITEAVIAAAKDLNFNLVAYYIAKHALNTIRQLGGYKDGKYVKVRDGVEDNVVLHECITPFSITDVLDTDIHLVKWNEIMHRVFDAFGVPMGERPRIEHYLKDKAISQAK